MRNTLKYTVIVAFLALAFELRAGTNNEKSYSITTTNNIDNNGEKTLSDPGKSKYSFTLFSFFTSSEKQKSDSTQIQNTSTPVKKEGELIN